MSMLRNYRERRNTEKTVKNKMLKREKRTYFEKKSACHVKLRNSRPLQAQAQYMNSAIYGEFFTGNFQQAGVCTSSDVAKPYDAFCRSFLPGQKRTSRNNSLETRFWTLRTSYTHPNANKWATISARMANEINLNFFRCRSEEFSSNQDENCGKRRREEKDGVVTRAVKYHVPVS